MRLVDADALIKALNENGVPYRADVQEVLDAQPTVDAVPRWIPCEERLPEYFEPVITWDGYCYYVEKRIPYILGEDGDQIKSEWWVSDDYDEEETNYFPNLRDGAAIAWMPLPEPYKGERKDDECIERNDDARRCNEYE